MKMFLLIRITWHIHDRHLCKNVQGCALVCVTNAYFDLILDLHMNIAISLNLLLPATVCINLLQTMSNFKLVIHVHVPAFRLSMLWKLLGMCLRTRLCRWVSKFSANLQAQQWRHCDEIQEQHAPTCTVTQSQFKVHHKANNSSMNFIHDQIIHWNYHKYPYSYHFTHR